MSNVYGTRSLFMWGTALVWTLHWFVCVCTSITSVCVCDGTHSSASSEQQPPQRRSVTHDGRKRWCVSHGNSRQTSTSVSLGWHPLFWYTSNHLTTERERENQWITLRKTHSLFMECSGFSTESVTSYCINFTLMHSTRIIRQPASSLIYNNIIHVHKWIIHYTYIYIDINIDARI